jgi:PAS domain S-box-containing protein
MSEKNVSTYPWFVEGRNIALISLALFFFLSGITFFLCYEHHQSATEHSLKGDRAAANLLSIILDEHLQKIIKTMESYTSRPLLIQALKNKNAKNAKIHLVSLVKNNPNIDSLVITDRQGKFWISYPAYPELTGKNLAYRDWYKGVSKDWKPYVSNAVLRIAGEKDVAVQISVPFFDEQGEVIGVLLNTQRTIGLGNIIKRVPLDSGSSVSVADRQGNMIYSSRYSFDKEITPYPFYSVIKKTGIKKDQSVAVPDPLFGESKGYISLASVSGTGWTVFVGWDSRTIFLSEATYYIQTTSITLLLFLMILLSLIYFRKRVMIQQVMDKLQAEEELLKAKDIIEESEQAKSVLLNKLNQAQQIAMIGSWDWDLVNNIVWWSDETYQIFGVSPQEFTPGFEANAVFIHPDDLEDYWKIFEHSLKTGDQIDHDLRIICKNSEIKYCNAKGSVEHDNAGTPVRFIGTIMDISERKIVEENIRKFNEELEERIAERTAELNETVAHLEELNRVFVGRELKMIELKEQIAELERQRL